MNDRQEQKLDRVLEGLNQLIPQVADNKAGVNYLRSNTKRLEVNQARHDERMENIEGDVNALGGKVRTHIGIASIHQPVPTKNAFADASVRWTFIAKVAGGLAAAMGLLAMLAKFIPHH